MSKNALAAALALTLVQAFAPAPAAAHRRSDAWITVKAKTSLLTTPDVPGTKINVDTVRGRITLHGIVTSQEQSRRAAEIARGIEGVTDVRNLIQVEPASRIEAVKVEDAQLAKDVKARLAASPALDDSSIHVQSVHDGVVLLGGKAATATDHSRALRVVRDVPGVTRVETQVTSPDRLMDEELWSANLEKAKKDEAQPASADAWTTTAVKLRLLAADDVPGMAINVDTEDGVVTLFGTVPTESAKSRAAEEAGRVESAKKVVNALQVVPESRQEAVQAKDEDIKAAVVKALGDSPDLADAHVDVQVENGVVRLTGTIVRPTDRLDAMLAARSVAGVRSVRDDMQIRSKAPKG